ncbi:MAG TPA: efflux RND transporter periplasmic adaptor subunit, partial [Puia sp.]
MQVLYKILFFLLLVFSLTISSCSEKAAATDTKEGYVLPDSLLKTIEIDTVSTAKVLNSLTLTGKVDFDEDRILKIYPVVSGQVSRISVMLGDYVKKGQVLAVLKSAEMAGFSNDLTLARSNLEVARKSLDAANDMYKSGLASQRDQLAARESYNQALSALQKAQRVLNLNGGSMDGDY